MADQTTNLDNLTSPILFRGDALHAYRDSAAIYHDGVFHLFFTFVEPQSQGGGPFMYVAISTSRDLIHWTDLRRLTPSDRSLNFCSPGSIVRYGDEWVLGATTYPRPNGEKYGNHSARLYKMRSRDLRVWNWPGKDRV